MVIKDVNIVTESNIFKSDILIEDKKVKRVGKDLKNKKIVNANGAFLLPGFIDLNVKFCDDKVNIQNIEKLSKDAIKGGVSKVLLNPDLNPPIDNEIILEFIKSQNREYCEILPMIKATKDENSLSEISILLKKGAKGIFFYSDIDSFLICRIFEYAKMHKIPLHCRARSSTIKSSGVMHEGEVSSILGLAGISEIEETSEVAKIIEFAKFYDVEVVFKSLSSSRSIDIIKKAKNEGIKVYSEVSIHHLLKTDKECEDYNTNAKIDPPLRDEKNRKFLIEHLKDGNIDILTSLHSPKSNVQKDISFDEAAFGIGEIDRYIQTIYDNLIKEKIIDFSKLLNLTYKNPLKILKKEAKEIKVGYDEDLILFDGKNVKKII